MTHDNWYGETENSQADGARNRHPRRPRLCASLLLALGALLFEPGVVASDEGVLLTSVDTSSAFGRAGLTAGHTITTVIARGVAIPVTTPLQLLAALGAQADPEGVVLIGESAEGGRQFVLPAGSFVFDGRPAITAGEADSVATALEAATTGDRRPLQTQAAAYASTNRAGHAVWLLTWGLRLSIREGHQQASTALLESLQRTLSLAPDPVLPRAQAWLLLGQELYDAGDLVQSQSLLDEALELITQNHAGSHLHAAILHALGRTLIYRGDTDVGIGHSRTALDLSQRSGDRYHITLGLERLGFGQLWIYDNDAAGLTLLRALDEARLIERGGPLEIDILLRLAVLHRQMRQLPEATAFARSALSGANTSERRLQRARATFELGVIKSMSYRLGEAEALQREVLELLQTTNRGAQLRVYALNSLGYLSQARGDFESANRYYQRALAAFETNGAWPDAALALQNIAYNAIDLRDYELAETAAQRSRDLQQQAGFTNRGLVNIVLILGQIALDSGRLEEAGTRYLEVEKLLGDSPPDAWDRWDLHYSRGLIALEQGAPERAIRYFEKALEITHRQAPGTVYVALPEYDLGRARERLGQPERALESYGRAIEAYESSRKFLGGGLQEHGSFHGRWARFYRDMITLQVGLGRIEDAFATLERYRARQLQDLAGSDAGRPRLPVPAALESALTQERNTHDRLLETLRNTQASSASAETHDNLVIELDASRARLTAMQSDIAAKVALDRLASIGLTANFITGSLQQHLGADEALLSYAVTDTSTLLFCFTTGQLQVFNIPVGASDLRAQVDRLRTLLSVQRPDQAIHTATLTALHDAWQTLMAPASACMGERQRIVIIPDGALHALPFAALITALPAESTVRPSYVLDQQVISVALSASQILAAGDARPLTTPDPGVTVIAFDPGKSPAGALHDGRHTPSLPRVIEEAEAIAALMGDRVKLLLGGNATERAVRSLTGTDEILHFAAHAVLVEQRPLDSWLQLASENTSPGTERSPPDDAPAGDDKSTDDITNGNGLLQAWEIAQFMRIDADLVTLSACETLVGRDFGGAALLGMHSAFFYAGARNVLGTLWRVDDASTAQLMTSFYAGLAAGQRPAQALRDAQRSWLDAAHEVDSNWREMFGNWRSGKRREDAAIVPHARWAAFQLNGSGL